MIQNCQQWRALLHSKLQKKLSSKKPHEKKQHIHLSGRTGVIATLTLPPRHPSSGYLKNIPLYDRFLPSLASLLETTVVDIGANIGDTVTILRAAGVSNKIVAVEPDKVFRESLDLNISENALLDIVVYPYAISSRKRFVVIEKNFTSSTGNASVADSRSPEAVETKTFAELLKENDLRLGDIGVVKIDTDGYDWDCLLSLSDFLVGHHPKTNELPFIYYEHQTCLNNLGATDPDRVARDNSYLDVLNRLRSFGYTHYVVFDNFGTPILSSADIDVISQLSRYIRMSQLMNTRTTFNYLDVLLYPPELQTKAREALKLHLSGTIIKTS